MNEYELDRIVGAIEKVSEQSKDYIPSDFIMGDDSFIIEEKIVLCINITPTNLKKLHKIKKRNKCTWNKVISILTT